MYLDQFDDFPFVNNCDPYKIFLFPGKYLFEAWGGSGGGELSGRGGFTSGVILIMKITEFLIFIGSEGEREAYETIITNGGCNGGGKGGIPINSNYRSGGGGGGATDIRLNDSYMSRIFVAGGGGGRSGTDYSFGGNGGGLIASDGGGFAVSQGASQIIGNEYGVGSDGRDGTSFTNGMTGNGGGGGGYRGGLASILSGPDTNAGGGGGSSYISGHHGCSVFSDYVFSKTIIKGGGDTFVSPLGTLEQGNIGNGFFRITYLSCFCRTICHDSSAIYHLSFYCLISLFAYS